MATRSDVSFLVGAMATVIKTSDQDPTLVKRLETVNVSDHLAEARLVLERARGEARSIIAQARRDAVEVQKGASERGYCAGFERGYQGGQEKGRQEAFEAAQCHFTQQQEQLLRTLTALVDEHERCKRDLSIRAHHDLLDFAVRVASRVTKRLAMMDREAAAGNLEAALQMVASPTDLVVRVHPVDAGAMREFATTLVKRISDAEGISIVEDDSVAPGGCVLHTAETDIDATVDTQLEQITKLLTGAKGDAA